MLGAAHGPLLAGSTKLAKVRGLTRAFVAKRHFLDRKFLLCYNLAQLLNKVMACESHNLSLVAVFLSTRAEPGKPFVYQGF